MRSLSKSKGGAKGSSDGSERTTAPDATSRSKRTADMPPPSQRFFVRCTFVGEEKKVRLEGSFRFIVDAPDTSAVLPRLEKAVNKLRRTKELPRHCEVFVEFILALPDARSGIVADFERWERQPRRFQAGHITTSEACATFVEGLPVYRYGQNPE